MLPNRDSRHSARFALMRVEVLVHFACYKNKLHFNGNSGEQTPPCLSATSTTRTALPATHLMVALVSASDANALRCEADPSRPMTTASEPLVVQHECFLDQPEGASWFSSQDKTAPMARSSQSGTAAQHMLVDRYAETLWLGEHHTGLAHFLNCIDRLKSSLEPEHVLLGLCQLVKSNSAISRRHQELARKLLPLPDETVVKQTSLASIVSDYEIILAQRALDVSASGLRPTDASSFRDRWISSMESRE